MVGGFVEVSERRGLIIYVVKSTEMVLYILFIEEYQAACGPCGTISPRVAGSSYRSHRREDRVRKAKRASQLNDADSARMREGW